MEESTTLKPKTKCFLLKTALQGGNLRGCLFLVYRMHRNENNELFARGGFFKNAAVEFGANQMGPVPARDALSIIPAAEPSYIEPRCLVRISILVLD